MTVTTTPLRTVGALTAGLLTLGMLAACTPEPEPTPTKTALFASDEEAFAAAEETYRAYTEAANEAEPGEGDRNPNDYLIGSALEGAIDAQRALDEAGLHVDGDVAVARFLPVEGSVQRDGEKLSAIACLDLTAARTLNAQGEDVTPADRPDVVASGVTMTWVKNAYFISEELDADDSQCDA